MFSELLPLDVFCSLLFCKAMNKALIRKHPCPMYRSKSLNPFWKVMQDVICDNLKNTEMDTVITLRDHFHNMLKKNTQKKNHSHKIGRPPLTIN